MSSSEMNMSTTPREMDLERERRDGIHDCFLNSEELGGISRLGWDVIKCDPNYAVATKVDQIGLLEIDSSGRQSAILTIARASYFPRAIERMRGFAQGSLPNELSTVARRRFRVSPDRHTIFVKGGMESSGTVHSSVSVAINERNSCHFRYPDYPFPQTICYLLVGSLLIQLETNSTDFEASQGVLSQIAALEWRS